MTDDGRPHCHMCDRLAASEAILLDDEHFVAFELGDRPGWVLFASKRHGEWTWDLTDDEAAAFGPLLKRLSSALKQAADTSHIYYVGLGENTLHFHGILASRHQPFAKDIQAALAQRGGEVADARAASQIGERLRQLLDSELTTRKEPA
jgi:diadenosine tetraphosphate (Ap4A) HIT family hydrolase